MWLKYPVIIFFSFLFFIIQTAFLPRFSATGAVPNLVFALFFIIIFFEKKEENKHNFFPEIITGFFLDIPLLSYFGLSTVSLLIVYFFKKVADYFLKDARGKYVILYFTFLFSTCFILYNISMYLLSSLLGFRFGFNLQTFQSLAYSLIFACAGFYVYGKLADYAERNRQLKLF